MDFSHVWWKTHRIANSHSPSRTRPPASARLESTSSENSRNSRYNTSIGSTQEANFSVDVLGCLCSILRPGRPRSVMRIPSFCHGPVARPGRPHSNTTVARRIPSLGHGSVPRTKQPSSVVQRGQPKLVNCAGQSDSRAESVKAVGLAADGESCRRESQTKWRGHLPFTGLRVSLVEKTACPRHWLYAAPTRDTHVRNSHRDAKELRALSTFRRRAASPGLSPSTPEPRRRPRPSSATAKRWRPRSGGPCARPSSARSRQT